MKTNEFISNNQNYVYLIPCTAIAAGDTARQDALLCIERPLNERGEIDFGGGHYMYVIFDHNGFDNADDFNDALADDPTCVDTDEDTISSVEVEGMPIEKFLETHIY